MKKLYVYIMTLALFCCTDEVLAKSCCNRKLNCILNTVNHIEQCACANSCQATAITGPMTITVPNSYCLANDIEGSIIIQADNVSLYGNNRVIRGDGTKINSGLVILGNNTTVSHLIIEGFQTGLEIRSSFNYLFDIRSNHNEVGIVFNHAPSNVLIDSYCYYNTQSAIEFIESNEVILDALLLFNTGNYEILNTKKQLSTHTKSPDNNEAQGIKINNSHRVTLKNSTIIGVRATGERGQAHGVYIDSLSNSFTSYNNFIADITGTLAAYGIQTNPTLNVTQLATTAQTPVLAMAAAPLTSSRTLLGSAGSSGSTIKTIDENNQPLSEKTLTTEPTNDIAITDNGEAIAVADDTNVIIYKSEKSEEISKIPTGETATAIAIKDTGDAYIVPVAKNTELVTYRIDKSTSLATVNNIFSAPADNSIDSFDDLTVEKTAYRAVILYDNKSNKTSLKIQRDYADITLKDFSGFLNLAPNALVKWYPITSNNTFWLAIGGPALDGTNNFYLYEIKIDSPTSSATIHSMFENKLSEKITAMKWNSDGSSLALTAQDKQSSQALGVLKKEYLFDTSESIPHAGNLAIVSINPTQFKTTAEPKKSPTTTLTFAWTNNNQTVMVGSSTNLITYPSLTFAKDSRVQNTEVHNVTSLSVNPLSVGISLNAPSFASGNLVIQCLTPYIGVPNVTTPALATTYSNVYYNS